MIPKWNSPPLSQPNIKKSSSGHAASTKDASATPADEGWESAGTEAKPAVTPNVAVTNVRAAHVLASA